MFFDVKASSESALNWRRNVDFAIRISSSAPFHFLFLMRSRLSSDLLPDGIDEFGCLQQVLVAFPEQSLQAWLLGTSALSALLCFYRPIGGITAGLWEESLQAYNRNHCMSIGGIIAGL